MRFVLRGFVLALLAVVVAAIAAATLPEDDASTVQLGQYLADIGVNYQSDWRPAFQDLTVPTRRAAAVTLIAESLRSGWLFRALGVALFLSFALPNNLRDLKAFYDGVMRPFPLGRWRAGGVKDDHITLARELMLFFLLYSAYELVEFILTLENRLSATVPNGEASFLADLLIRLFIVSMIFGAYFTLRWRLWRRWTADAEKREQVQSWLNKNLEGMRVTPGSLGWIAASLTLAGFLPAILEAFTPGAGAASGVAGDQGLCADPKVMLGCL